MQNPQKSYFLFSSLLFVLSGFFHVGCSTVSKKETEQIPVETQKGSGAQQTIDILRLGQSLGMNIPVENLGYHEKQFNSCRVGYGSSSNQNCQPLFFVVVNYQLLCRQSSGTVSVTIQSDELPPVRDQRITWNLHSQKGHHQTNEEGFGQLQGVFPISQRHQRLKISTGTDFLYAKAGDLKQALTPKDWCR
jgi:hypothetical protein